MQAPLDWCDVAAAATILHQSLAADRTSGDSKGGVTPAPILVVRVDRLGSGSARNELLRTGRIAEDAAASKLLPNSLVSGQDTASNLAPADLLSDAEMAAAVGRA